MGDDITVRPATADDLDALRGVARRAWEAAYADTFDPATIDELLERGYADEVLEELVDADDAALYVAVDEDVIGYAGAVEADEEPAADLNVYVDPDRWGQGVGAQLLEARRRTGQRLRACGKRGRQRVLRGPLRSDRRATGRDRRRNARRQRLRGDAGVVDRETTYSTVGTGTASSTSSTSAAFETPSTFASGVSTSR